MRCRVHCWPNLQLACFPSRVGSTSWLELQLLWTLSPRKPGSSGCNSRPARCHHQTDNLLQLPKLAVGLFVFYASHLPAATLHPDAAPVQPRIASHCYVQCVLKSARVWWRLLGVRLATVRRCATLLHVALQPIAWPVDLKVSMCIVEASSFHGSSDKVLRNTAAVHMVQSYSTQSL